MGLKAPDNTSTNLMLLLIDNSTLLNYRYNMSIQTVPLKGTSVYEYVSDNSTESVLFLCYFFSFKRKSNPKNGRRRRSCQKQRLINVRKKNTITTAKI